MSINAAPWQQAVFLLWVYLGDAKVDDEATSCHLNVGVGWELAHHTQHCRHKPWVLCHILSQSILERHVAVQ